MNNRHFTWDTRVSRYRVTKGSGRGQFISQTDVDGLVEEYVTQQKNKAAELTTKLKNKKITPDEFEIQYQKVLKKVLINSYALGVGGVARLTNTDKSNIGFFVFTQYGFLNNFVAEISAGKLSDAQVESRARSYINQSWAIKELGRRVGFQRDGFISELNILNGEEHCSECVIIANQGWVLIGSSKPIGTRICLANDRCTLQFSKSAPSQLNQANLIDVRSGWLK